MTAKIFLGFLLLGVCSNAYAVGITSAGTGLWSAASTWNPATVPTAIDSVTINAGHIVTVDVMTAVSNGALVKGTLKASRVANSRWTLVGGNLNVNAGSTLDYGSEADPIPTAINAQLMLSLGTYAGQYGLIVNNGGNFTVCGSTKTPYSFAVQSITTADTSLMVYGSTSTAGWQAGDIITIAPTSGSGPTTTASRTITSVTGGPLLFTIAWSGGTLPQARILSATSPIIVANLTRNVLVRSLGTIVDVGGDSAYIRNLVQNATSFALAHGEFAYLGANVSGKYGITFDGSLVRGTISSSTVRNGYRGVRLDYSSNNTLIRNNLYSNSSQGISLGGSSTNTLTENNSYSNSYGVYIVNNSNNNTLTGNNLYSNSSDGISLNTASNNTLTENNSYSNSSYGIYTSYAATNTLIGNNSYSNLYGIYIGVPSQNNTLTGNNSYSNSSYGIYIESSSSTLTGNNSYSNSSYGIGLGGASNNTLTENNSHSNSGNGFSLGGSSNNTLTRNNSYSNLYGISLGGSSKNNTLTENNSYSNSQSGISLDSSSNTLIGNNSYFNDSGINLYTASNNTVTGNNSYSNSQSGIYLNTASNNTLTGNNLYSNTVGISLYNASLGNTFAGGNLGYDVAGVSHPNGDEIVFYPSSASSLILKGTRVNPVDGAYVPSWSMSMAGEYLLSYNQDYSTGTVRLLGNYQVAGSTLTLDYALQLYTSTNTAPKLMRGNGHSITAIVTKDAATLSELITITALGGSSWKVEGSSSGILNAAFPCATGACVFTHVKVDFTLNVGVTINAADALDFVTTAASGDSNFQKSLLFGPAATTFNQGRSKLEAAATGGIILRGKTDGTANTLVDRLSALSTYYTFVDSGAFTAAFTSFANADPDGIQLSGTAGVSLSSSTFDFMGFTSGTNTYITARNLTSNATFYNVVFEMSRPTVGYDSAYNMRVEGDDSGLAVLFKKSLVSLGQIWGEAYDYDPNAKVNWIDMFPPPGSPVISGVQVSSITVTYGLAAGANGYVVDASTSSNFTGTPYSSSTVSTSLTALSPAGLSQGTTYYLRAGALWGAATNYTHTVPASAITLALGQPGTPAGTALGVSSISWIWAAAANISGYKVYQASNPTTLIASTATAPFFHVDLATNTAYGIVVAGINGSDQGPLSVSATACTLAAPPTGFTLVQVIVSSITLSWAANTNPSGSTYRVDRWTAGSSTISVTASGDSAALTGLTGGTTYFFTVQAQNGDGVLAPSGIILSTVTNVAPSAIGTIGSGGGIIVFNPSTGQGEARVDIPVGAFSEAVVITLQTPASFPNAASPTTQLKDVGVGLEITLNKALQPAKDVDISISYQNASLPAGTDESRLIVARYDVGRNVWVPLVSSPDPVNHKVRAKTNHFSVFQIMEAAPSNTVSTAKAFPNPFQPSQGHTSMTFAALPANAKIKIYTLTGQLVKDLTADAVGMVSWDVTNKSGEKAASGVYFVFAKGAGEKRTFKVIVQR